MVSSKLLKGITIICTWFITGIGSAFAKSIIKSVQKKQLHTRLLGKTGVNVSSFGLGGEGVMRTYGRMKEAVAVIHKALDLGVTYFDTAPAYAQSQDYLGEALQGKERQDFSCLQNTQ